MTRLPYFERVKIQAEILLPLYRRLREELGSERANALLREAVREFAGDLGRQAARSGAATPLEQLRELLPAFTAGDALDVEVLSDTATEMNLDVRRCAYATYFHELGEPEFGAMLTCEVDPSMTEAIGGGLELKRSETIMAGAKRCDFRWRTVAAEPTSG